MMDSGATHHITPHRSDFETYMLISDLSALSGSYGLRDIGL
jgi:hypothetical protein